MALADFINAYRDIVAANGGPVAEPAPQAQGPLPYMDAGNAADVGQALQANERWVAGLSDPNNDLSSRDVAIAQDRRRQMNPIEQGLTGIRGFGEDILAGANEFTGFNPEAGFTAENIVNMLPTLPAQMLSGVTEGLSQGYEAVTRKNILEGYDPETGTVLDYSLDTGEAAAQAFNALINVGGIVTGGTARPIGLASKMLSGGKIGGRMARGSFASESANKIAGFAGQTAFDAAEEAGEEFVQAYLDDARFHHDDSNTFERAVEGAAWGAIGGGAMSATMQGINAAYDNIKGNTSNDKADANQSQGVQSKASDFNEMRALAGNLRFQDYTQKAYEESLGKTRGVVGSGSATNVNTSPDLAIDQFRMGVEDIKATYNRSAKDQEAIERRLGLSHDAMVAALMKDGNGKFHALSNTYDKASDALNALLENREIEMVLGRNPDTKNGGFKANLVGTFEGSGLQLNSGVMTMVGSDFDADRSQYYFDTDKLNVNGWAHDLLVSSEGRKSNLDWDFLIGDKFTEDAARNMIAAATSQYGQDISDAAANGVARAASMKASKDPEVKKGWQFELSEALMQMQNDINAQQAGAGTAILNQFVNDFKSADDQIFTNLTNRIVSTVKHYVNIELNSVDLPSGGAVKKGTRFTELFKAIALNPYQIGPEGNVMFRQYGQVYYASQDKGTYRSWAESIAKEIEGGEDVAQAIVRAGLRMQAMGFSPATTIEGMIDTMVISRTLAKVGSDFRISTTKDIDAFLDVYIEVYNSYVEVFNKAQETMTADGFNIPSDGKYKNKISGKEDGQLIRSFAKTFSTIPMNDLFKDVPGEYAPLTLGEVLDIYHKNAWEPRLDFADRPGLQQFVNRLINGSATEKSVLSVRLRNLLKDSEAWKIRDAWDASNGNLTIPQQMQAGAYLDGLNMIMSPEIGLAVGLRGVDILNTDAGRMLFSKDQETVWRAMIAMSWDEQFRPIAEGLASGDQVQMLRANYALEQKAGVSPLHLQICKELVESKGQGSDLLNKLTDLDRTWVQLENAAEEALGHTDFDLFLDSLKTESSDFDLSGTTDRMKKAENAFTKSVKLRFERENNEVKALKTAFTLLDGSDQSLVAWFESVTGDIRAQHDLSSLGLQAWAATQPSHDAVEKAVIQDAAHQAAIANQLVQNQRQLSLLDSFMSEPFGEVRIDTFWSSPYYLLTLLSDKNASFTVVDDFEGDIKYATVTRDVIFSSVSPNYNADHGPSAIDIFNLLEAHPQLSGWLCTQQPQFIEAGGQAGTSNARVETLEESYKYFHNTHGNAEGDDVRLKAEIRRDKRKVENALLNFSGYKGLLVRCAGDKIKNLRNPADFDRVMRETHRQMRDAMYYAAATGGPKNSRALKEMLSRLESDVRSKVLKDCESIISVARSNMELRGKDVERSIARELQVNLANLMAVQVANDMGVKTSRTWGTKASTGTIQSYINNAEADIKSAIKITAIMYRLYGESLDQTFTPDIDVLRKIESDIAAAGKDVDEFRGRVRHRYSNMLDFSSIGTMPTFFNKSGLKKNGKPYLEKPFKDTCKKIAEEAGVVPGENEIENDWNEYEKGGGDRATIVQKWNGIAMKGITDDINHRFGASLSGNMLNAADKAILQISDYVDRIRMDSSLGIRWGDTETRIGGPVDFPIPTTVDAEVEAIVNNMQLMDNSGYSEMKVSLNGSMTKHLAGLGFLPKFILPDVPPQQTTVGEVLAEAQKADAANLNWHYLMSMPGENMSSDDLRVVGSSLDELGNLPPDTVIFVYDPKYSPHGADSAFVPASYTSGGKDYHRLGRILLDIIAWSQEGMVLKAKKTLDAQSDVLADVHKKFSHSNTVTMGPDVKQSLSSALIKYRDKMAELLNEDFQKNGRLGKNGSYGLEEALILAQACTPGIEVTLTDGTSTEARMIDASVIFGPQQAFDAFVQELTNNGAMTVSNATIRVFSPTVASYRIMRAVSDEFHSDNHNHASVRSAANKAMNDWSDLKCQTLDVNELLSGCSHIGNAFRVYPTAEGSRTAMQYFIARELGEDNLTMRTDAFRAAEPLKETRDINLRNTKISQSKNYFGNENADIVHVFYDESKTPNSYEASEAVRQYNAINKEPWKFNWAGPNQNTRAIVVDDSELDKAKAWSRSTGSSILVSNEQFERMKNGPDRYATYASIPFQMRVEGKVREFHTVNFARDAIAKHTLAGVVSDKSTYLHPDEIRGTFIDGGAYQLGDAVIAVDPEDGVLKTSGFGIKPIPLTTLFGQSASSEGYMIADANAVAKLKRNYESNPSEALKSIRFGEAKMTVERRDEMLRTFFESFEVGSGDNMRRKNVEHGEIVAFAYHNGEYSPIILPSTAPAIATGVYIDTQGTRCVLGWTGEAGLGVDKQMVEFVKGSLTGESFKGIMSVLENGARAPRIAGGADDRCSYIVSAAAEGSRAHGRDRQFLVDTLYYLSRKYRMSMLFEYENGKWVWNKHLRNVDSSDLDDLLLNNWTAWDKIASGEIRITDDLEVQKDIQAILAKVKLYNGRPLDAFSSIRIDEHGNATPIQRENFFHLYFDDMPSVRLFAFYSKFNSETLGRKLCLPVKDFDPDADFADKPLVDMYGRTLCEVPDGNGFSWEYNMVRWGNPKIIGEVSGMMMPSGHATWSWQHVYSRGLENGYLDSEFADAVMYSDYLLNVTEHFNFHKLPKPPDTYIKMDDAEYGQRISEIGQRILSMPGVGYSEVKVKEKIAKRAYLKGKVRPVRENGEFIDNPANHPKIKLAVDRLNSRLKFDDDKKLTYEQVSIEAANLTGFTWDENGSAENNSVDVNTLCAAIDDMIELALRDDVKLPIANSVKKGKTRNGRYALPMLSPIEREWWWGSEVIRRNHISKEQFKDAIKAESDKALAQLQSIPSEQRDKRHALELAFTYDYHINGYKANTTRIWGNSYLADLVEADAELVNAMVGAEKFGGINIDPNDFNRLTARQQQIIQDLANYSEYKAGVETANVNIVGDQALLNIKTRDGRDLDIVLENATQLSKILALINPGVFASNFLDRGIHQGIMNFAMRLGHMLPIGPYTGKAWLNQDRVTNAINQEFFVDVYGAYRMAQFTDDEYDFLAKNTSHQAIVDWMNDRKQNMTGYQRAVDRIYNLATGGNKMLKTQIRNFVNRFVMFCEQDPEQAALWLRDVTDENGNTMTYLEQRLMQDAGGWFLEVMGAASRPSPSFEIAMKAMNSAKQGDMAQRNALWMLFQHITKDTPLSKFFVTTTVMRFPEYTLNVTGRMLNWLLPMSTINYIFTENVSKLMAARAEGSDSKYNPHIELAQVHTSLKEAMMVDITHLGVGAVAMILVAMSGGVEPPEDEKKWGNPDEWIICGMRVGEAWWIEDILGIALPMACFTRSAQLGNPRFDLLVNGVNQACYNNPIIKLTDAAGFLLEPEGRFVTDFEDDVIAYQKAKGGPPSYTDWMLGNGMNFGLSWASQFFTPSILREFYNNMQQWEASYKRIYAETPTGVLSEEGAEGSTEMTTYMDAMVRRATRRNPVLGFLMNLVTGGTQTTGYMAHEMPDVLYYDDAQIASMEKWSIDGLSDEDAKAKILEIITVMQQYDDMEELRSTGFYLDGKTKAALSSVVWDTIYEFDDFLDDLKAQGKNDFYYLGNGDYIAGQMVWKQLEQSVDAQKRAWQNFYYDKVRSSALSEPLVTYKRYNTNYAQDSDGNFYATGFRPTGVLPFVGAPGTMANPEGTAGYENDWVTVSAVTGQPMEGQRALVPVKGDVEEWPDLEYWAGNEDGTGHSALYKQWYGTGGDGTLRGESVPGLSSLSDIELPEGLDLSKEPDGTSRNRSGYPRSGGYSRRGGGGSRGGGGGSTPNIYSRVDAPNISNPDTMRSSRIYDANYDYLRPNFETKGSREAYKRGDI